MVWTIAPWTLSAAAAMTPYRDTLIDGGMLTLDVVDEGYGAQPGDTDGPWRGVTLETHWSTRSTGLGGSSQRWEAVDAFHDSANWGLLGLSIRRDPAGTGFTLRQQDMPLSVGWRGHHELGEVVLPTPELGGPASRFGLPTARAWGLHGQWEHAPGGERWWAAVGEVPSRERTQRPQSLDGPAARLAMLGMERAGPSTHYGVVATAQPTGAGGLYQGLRWSAEDWAVQTHMLTTRSSQKGWKAAAWTDIVGTWEQHHFSAGLRSVANDVEWLQSPLPVGDGAYARWRYQASGGWAAAEADVQHTKDHHQGWAWLSAGWRSRLGTWSGQLWHLAAPATAQTHLQAAHELTSGAGGLQWRQALQAQHTTASVPARWQWSADLATEQRSGRWQLGVELPVRAAPEQARWLVRAGWVSPWAGALSGSVSAQAQQPGGGARTSGGGSASLRWRFAPGWALQTAWQREVGQGAAVSGTPGWAELVASGAAAVESTSWSIGLRYDWRGGRPTAGAGSGMVYGFAFYDTNRNGSFDPAERPASGVTLTIGNRYSVRTDTNGRYATPIAAGLDHTLRVRSEELPLPWTALHEQKTFSIQPREDLRLDVALVTL